MNRKTYKRPLTDCQAMEEETSLLTSSEVDLNYGGNGNRSHSEADARESIWFGDEDE